MNVHLNATRGRADWRLIACVIVAAGAAALVVMYASRSIGARPADRVEREQAAARPDGPVMATGRPGPAAARAPRYDSRHRVDTGGFLSILNELRWNAD